MRVKCYRNLHKKCYSIVDLKAGKVFKHQFHVVLKDAWFQVSECGRKRVLKERRKNVHAWIRGTLLETNFGFPDLQPKEAYYNPYKTKTFVDKETNEPVERASIVMLAPGHIYYWEEECHL
jgi:hypothetical protein